MSVECEEIIDQIRWVVARGNNGGRGLSQEICLSATLDRLRRYIAELESAREWRPIETAPKQDLFLGTDGDIVEISSWSMDRGIAYYNSGSYDDPIRYRPTHWMPVPEPPK